MAVWHFILKNVPFPSCSTVEGDGEGALVAMHAGIVAFINSLVQLITPVTLTRCREKKGR